MCLAFKERISIKILHFASEPSLRTYYVLGVGDVEEKVRGVAKVNKDQERFLENLTVSSVWMGRVGRSGARLGVSRAGGSWAEMKAG